LSTTVETEVEKSGLNNESQIASREIRRLEGYACLSRMTGEFLREIAVLVVVFVPLELWKAQQPGQRVSFFSVFEACIFFLVSGMLMELIAKEFERNKKVKEREYGRE
jgi:hypothetical protein